MLMTGAPLGLDVTPAVKDQKCAGTTAGLWRRNDGRFDDKTQGNLGGNKAAVMLLEAEVYFASRGRVAREARVASGRRDAFGVADAARRTRGFCPASVIELLFDQELAAA